MKEQYFDIIIIGSGIAGMNAALIAAKNGLKVGLVEEDKLGGDSLNYSDLPLKFLSTVTRKIQEARQLESFGIASDLVSFNYSKILGIAQQIVARSAVANLNSCQKQQIEVIPGRAYFINPNRISVNKTHYLAKKFLIATGASWQIPKIAGLDQVNFHTPRQIFDLQQLPNSLLVIGGHPSAVIISQIFATLGVRTHLICPNSRLLPDFDDEINQILLKILSDRYKIITATNSQVLEVSRNHQAKKILFSHAGIERQFEVDEIIIAQKLLPNTDLGLNNAAVNFTEQGILTNLQLQSSNKNIYAAGDVLGINSNPNSALLESEIAILNLLKRRQASVPSIIANVIEAPTLASSVGLSQNDCQAQNIAHRLIKVDFAETARQLLSPSTEFGTLHIIVNQKNQLIGAQCLGPEADLIIQQLTPLIKTKASADQLFGLSSSLLSWQEVINIAANRLAKRS